MENPTTDEVESFADARFAFRGFDLIEVNGTISTLVNCGGFDKTFSNNELSEFGLITDFRRAFAIQRSLPADYPNEPHAECNIWAIWQMVS
jgi:hypothetical protein